jgi:hypothetical protein
MFIYTGDSAGKQDDNVIWSPGEVADAVDDDIDDGRPPPAYEFTYKQAVQTTDVYLGLDPMGKDPTSTSCEDLVLTVTLPEASSVQDVDVDLKPTWVIVRTGVQCASYIYLRAATSTTVKGECLSR